MIRPTSYLLLGSSKWEFCKRFTQHFTIIKVSTGLLGDIQPEDRNGWMNSAYGRVENCIQNVSSRADATVDRCRRDDNIRKDRSV
jgi:hypothetical protein